jgi:hypothetical protein
MTPMFGLIASSISGNLSSNFDSIATVTVGAGGSTSISFGSIPIAYKHLQIRGMSRTNLAALGFASLTMQFNSDTATSYDWHRLWGNGSAANAGSTAPDSSMLFGVTSADQNTANEFSVFVTDILDFQNTNKNKVIRTLTGGDDNVGGASGYVGLHSGEWRNTAAVTSIVIAPGSGQSFKQYSSFALYGIKG